jgi:stringent starvation protein B
LATPTKKDVALALLSKSSIFVQMDPRREGVVVPKQFQSQRELVLQFGHDMRVPILDLEVDDEGISGTLSFNRRPFWCRIPWSAVFAIVNEERKGMSWPEDGNTGSRVGGAPSPKRSHLRAVGPEDDAPSEADAASVPEGEGTCTTCNARWPEDLSTCAVCGSSRSEAFRPSGEASPSHEGGTRHHGETLGDDAGEPAVARPNGAPAGLSSVPPPEKSDSDDDDEPEPPPPPRGRPQLRLVKK